MSAIQAQLSRFFQPFSEQPIVVAYSGGIDSQVLLHALSLLKKQNKITNELFVCHVNHGLSEHALSWQKSAEKFCQQLGLPLAVFQVNVKEVAGESLEALARTARYQALKNYAPNNALIVTGHHLDDQSETFLLALKRGAGLKGLSAMSESIEVEQTTQLDNEMVINNNGLTKKQHRLVRPLLSISRQEIHDYALHHQLTWVEDESNKNLRFDRNFIRHQIMPLLVKRWPSIQTTIKRSSEHCQEGQLLLDELAAQDLQSCQLTRHQLSIKVLSELSIARFNNLLRYFIKTHQGLMPSTGQLKQIHQQVFAANDKTPAVKVANYWFRRYRDALYLTSDYLSLTAWQAQISLKQYPCGAMDSDLQKQVIELPDGLGQLTVDNLAPISNEPYVNIEANIERAAAYHVIKVPCQAESFTIRFTHQNPKCLPEFRQRSRELKKVLQELSIPPWQRKRIPFIYDGNALVGAVGYFICKEYLAEAGESSIVISLSNSDNSD